MLKENIDFIRLEKITKTYPNSDKIILKSVNLEIYKSEILCLLGYSGSGKTTLVDIIAGNIRQDSGDIYVNDVIINSKSIYERNFRFVSHTPVLFDQLTILENIRFGIREDDGRDKNKIEEQIQKYIIKLGISDILDRYPREISDGQRYRVTICRAIASRSDLIILDEPFNDLDYQNKKAVVDIIKDINSTFGTTFIIVSNGIADVKSVAQRYAVVDNGNIVDTGDLHTIQDYPKSKYTVELFNKYYKLSLKMVEIDEEKLVLGDVWTKIIVERNLIEAIDVASTGEKMITLFFSPREISLIKISEKYNPETKYPNEMNILDSMYFVVKSCSGNEGHYSTILKLAASNSVYMHLFLKEKYEEDDILSISVGKIKLVLIT